MPNGQSLHFNQPIKMQLIVQFRDSWDQLHDLQCHHHFIWNHIFYHIMRFIQRFSFLLSLLLFATQIPNLDAQDTTALRFAAFSDGGELMLFKNDSTNLYYDVFNADASFNALFHHPVTGQLYCLFDSIATTGRRNFYEIDPFSGAMSFVFAPSADFLAAACVGPNGVVYAITGYGAGNPGNIYQIDIFSGTENLFASPDVTFGGNFQPAMNISYYPPTNEIWIFCGDADSLIKINVNTQVETHVAVSLQGDAGIKGTYLDGNTMWLCSDASYTLDATVASAVQPSNFVLPDYVTDLELLDLIDGSDTIGICSGDSVQMHSRFRFDDYHWYFNGVPLPGQNRSFMAGAPGTYQLLAQWDSNAGIYIWSETVELVAALAPTAGFGTASTSFLIGTPIVFTDSSLNANAYHWDFGDGSFSAASNPTHTYNAPGTYTVMQVVQNGLCTDTAYLQITILLVGMDGAANQAFSMTAFPNPTSDLMAVSIVMDQVEVATVEVLDMMGASVAVLHNGPLDAGNHSWHWNTTNAANNPVAGGIYVLRLKTDTGNKSQRIMVIR